MHNGVKPWWQTPLGWQLLCQWKDGSTNRVALKDMKESYPIQVADYARANQITDEPAGAWWVLDVFQKQEQVSSKVKVKYWQCTHNFGICIPKSVVQAQVIDQENSDTLWWDAIMMEMRNVRPPFEKYEKEKVTCLLATKRLSALLCLMSKCTKTPGGWRILLQMETNWKRLQL